MIKPFNKHVSKSVLLEIREKLGQPIDSNLLQDDKAIAAWFMGCKGENVDLVNSLVSSVINKTLENRRDLFENDPPYISKDISQHSEEYKHAKEVLLKKNEQLTDILTKYSVPFSSLRYQGHMTWDISLPSIAGYLSGMLQNQNNVTPQAAPVTCLMEILAASDIAQMAGFSTRPLIEEPASTPKNSQIYAWSHITCDGTVANIESVWAARELKFLPLSIRYAIESGGELAALKNQLRLANGEYLDGADTTAWMLLNLQQDEALALPRLAAEKLGREESEIWKLLGEKYSLNAKGMNFFCERYFRQENIKAPAIIVPSTKHYSWVKSTSLLGMGGGQKGLTPAQQCNINTIENDGLINIYVDEEGRVDTQLLDDVLFTCREGKKPILLNVAVVGSTEEGSVDPVETLYELREKYRAGNYRDTQENNGKPFDYSLHADAAWGGYFLSCIRKPFEMENTTDNFATASDLFDNDTSLFRDSVYESMRHIHRYDSVTIDPHKMGYIPYPAGSLTYRNEAIINLLSFTAPYISSENHNPNQINTRNIGDSGIEGSKPGAAASSIFLAHQVIRPDKRGYGHIINQSMLNSKLFYLYLATIDIAFPNDKFNVLMLTPLPEELLPQREKISAILWQNNAHKEALIREDLVVEFLRAVSGDQNIVDYIFTDKSNGSIERANTLNNDVFNALSIAPGEPVGEDQIFVSKTTFLREDYGSKFMDALSRRFDSPAENINAIGCIRSVILDPWAIYTHPSAEHGIFNFFTGIYFPKLRTVVNELCNSH